ncbi:MAG TPA: co-chaperone GroES [Thermodesulfovibrionales bacterium]|nr:co-chaperone GroES [Thermodesulfovibrionales bacterium]
MRVRPLHDWVLIRRDKPEEKTPSGLIIPGSARSEPSRGVVEAIGPGRYKKVRDKKGEKFLPTVLTVGQWVFFLEYAARDVELDGEKITLIREEDVLGTFEPSEKRSATAAIKEGEHAAAYASGHEERTVGNALKKTKTKRTVKPARTIRKAPVPRGKTRPSSTNKEVKKVKTKKTVPVKKTSKKVVSKKIKTGPRKATAKKTVAKRTAAKSSGAKAVPRKVATKRNIPKKKSRKKR